MEYNEGIDSLLRRSMAQPIPGLPPDFDQRVMRSAGRSSQPLARYRQTVITSYGLVSVVVCTALMRGQGLGWGTVAGMILGPLALLAITTPLWSREKNPIATAN
jgi:hypothetical protein